jgi:hypothetical protein
MSQEQLQRAYNFIKVGQQREAMEILRPIVRNEPDNADAWWLVANAVTETDFKRRALENVIRLRPNHVKAQNMLDQLNASMSDDPFADLGGPVADPYGDPFASSAPPPAPRRSSMVDVDGELPRGRSVPLDRDPVVVRPARSGPNGCMVILAIIGGLALCSCIACFALVNFGGAYMVQALGENFAPVLTAIPGGDQAEIQRAIEEWMRNSGIDADINFGTLTGSTSGTIPASVIVRGAIERGQTQTDTLSSGQQHGWTFTGTAGQRVVIELNGRGDIDPKATLYGPTGQFIAEHDDIDFADGNRNSRIEVVLPANGQYTIVAQLLFNASGSYELILS